MTESNESPAGSLPLTSNRRSKLREHRSGRGVEIELVTNTGAVVAVLAWFPLSLLSGLALDRAFWMLGIPDSLFVMCVRILLVPAMATVILVEGWMFRRIVRIGIADDGLALTAHRETTVVPINQIEGIRLYRYERDAAYGLDLVRFGTTPLEIRAWDPTEREASLVRDRIQYLVETLRTGPYRASS